MIKETIRVDVQSVSEQFCVDSVALTELWFGILHIYCYRCVLLNSIEINKHHKSGKICLCASVFVWNVICAAALVLVYVWLLCAILCIWNESEPKEMCICVYIWNKKKVTIFVCGYGRAHGPVSVTARTDRLGCCCLLKIWMMFPFGNCPFSDVYNKERRRKTHLLIFRIRFVLCASVLNCQ